MKQSLAGHSHPFCGLLSISFVFYLAIPCNRPPKPDTCWSGSPKPEACWSGGSFINYVSSSFSQWALGMTKTRTQYLRSWVKRCSHWGISLAISPKPSLPSTPTRLFSISLVTFHHNYFLLYESLKCFGFTGYYNNTLCVPAKINQKYKLNDTRGFYLPIMQ